MAAAKFVVGQYVDVDADKTSTLSLGVARITEMSEKGDVCHVHYIVEMVAERDVSVNRLRPSLFLGTTRRKRNQEDVEMPSLLAPSQLVTRVVRSQQVQQDATINIAQRSLKNVLHDAAKL